MTRRRRLSWFGLCLAAAALAVAVDAARADRARRRQRRIQANEAEAVATLRLIAEAQERFRATGIADVDGDGIGEYGVFRELAGTVAVRTSSDGYNGGGSVLGAPLLPRPFGTPSVRHAEVRRAGYFFKVFLPGQWPSSPEFSGGAVEESAFGSTDTLDGTVHWVLPEHSWCAYAWPIRHRHSGRRTFFVNQDRIVTSTSQRLDRLLYAGRRAVDEVNAGSAFVAGEGWLGAITGTQAVGTVGRDGNFWKAVE